MKQVSSSQNPPYKNFKALMTSAKERREQHKAVIEGIHLADSYIQTGALPAMCVVGHSAQENHEVAAIIAHCEGRDVHVLVISDHHFRAVSGLENGISVALIIDQPVVSMPAALDQSALLIDGVQDPGNFGTILRTAASAGITSVYCSSETAGAWSPKTLRAGMGAHFALNIYENVDLAEVVEASNVPIYATTLQAQKSIYEVDLSQPAAWIVGNEGRGVSASLLSLSVEQVIIPQNTEVESLNVAAATAVCLFEQRRQQLGA